MQFSLSKSKKEKVFSQNSTLTDQQKKISIALIQENSLNFSWNPSDMPSISPNIKTHWLNVYLDTRPVQQKKRLYGREKQSPMGKEVERLSEVRFIREVLCLDWLANLVLVKKANDKYRMCIDFTNLNQVCPKDCYPFHNINKLVDSTAGFDYLPSLDAMSEYHQILMDKNDEEKTSFIIDNGTYCYKAMPFSLKNTGATY